MVGCIHNFMPPHEFQYAFYNGTMVHHGRIKSVVRRCDQYRTRQCDNAIEDSELGYPADQYDNARIRDCFCGCQR